MTLAVLFSDIRGFTAFAEGNLPYDIVHALNRYFNAIGQAIDENGGYIDKYMGDGIMALFGLNPYREEHPCLDAVTAALGMLSSLRGVNDYMSAHLGHEFTIGIGIHYGTVVVGEIGFKLRKQFTAIGDTVNLAARLESETKNLEADILVSDQVRRELPPGSCRFGHSVELTLKGKSGLYKAHELLTRSGES
jgi:adenylate cyclase